MTNRLEEFIDAQQLPQAFWAVVDDYYLPLAQWLYTKYKPGKLQMATPPVVGVSGAQGTGKSTLSAILKIILEGNYGWRTAILSLDDIYLGRIERQTLAQTVHPLLQTRGVPGTHDTGLGIDIIAQLQKLTIGHTIQLPRFDKALDDRKPLNDWEAFTGPADLIIFEGWCVGSQPFDSGALITPINSLEAEEDPDRVWRNYINQRLLSDYRALFATLDTLIMLKAPNFDCVRRWRLEQEQKLATQSALTDTSEAPNQIMNKQSLSRFIQHYERLTLHNLAEMPDRANVVLSLDSQHQITDSHYKTR